MALNVSLDFPTQKTHPIAGVLVHRYQLREALSELFELSISIASTDPVIDVRSVVGQAAVVRFDDQPALTHITGIVRSVRQLSSVVLTSTDAAASMYELVIVPPLWLTTRRRDHRILQRMNAAAIVAEVLAGYGGRIAAPVTRFSKDPQIRDYVVQYGETDWEFITRVLSYDFIASFFDHDNESAYVLLDDSRKMLPSPVADTPFVPPSALVDPPPHIFNICVSSSIETSAATLRDYDYGHSQLSLDGHAQSLKDDLFVNEGSLEAYAYEIGEFADGDVARERAEHWLEAVRTRARTFLLETNFSLAAGARISVYGHPRDDANGDFLVIRTRAIADDGVRAGLSTRATPTLTHLLECIPSSIPFLPTPRPKPRIYGTQTAKVVGAVDGATEADSAGRVQVLFNWDRQRNIDKKTRPVRVAQAWAGTAYGFFALPRVGDEVVVTYLDGDPDEPLIVARVHNNLRTTPFNPSAPPYDTVSAWRSQTIGDAAGYNEILMDDRSAAERLELHAQRNFKSTTEHDSVTLVKHDKWITVGANASEQVHGAYTMQSGSVTVACGPYKLTSQKTTIEVSNDMELHAEYLYGVGKSEILLSTPKLTLAGGGATITFEDGNITIEADTITLKATTLVDVDAAEITLN